MSTNISEIYQRSPINKSLTVSQSTQAQLNSLAAKHVDVQGQLTYTLFFSVFCTSLGSSFQGRYNNNVLNAPEQNFIRSNHRSLFQHNLTTNEMNFMWSIIKSLYPLGGVVGGILSGVLADKIGRKGAILFNNMFAIAAIYFTTMSFFVNQYYLFFIGRFVSGINSGICSGVVSMYVNEISPFNLRGKLGIITNNNFPIVLSQFLGLSFIFGTFDKWIYIFVFQLIPAIFLILSLPFLPESPIYSMWNDKLYQVEVDLKMLRNTDDIQDDLNIIKKEAAIAKKQHKVGIFDLLKKRWRWSLLIAAVLMIAQQLSGISMAIYFLNEIFKHREFKHQYIEINKIDNNRIYATMAMISINIIWTIVILNLIEHRRFGRRKLLLIGITGVFYSSFFYFLTLLFIEHFSELPGHEELRVILKILAVTFVFLFASFGTCPGLIPWVYVNEIFPFTARGSANSIAVFINWLADASIALYFPNITPILGAYTFCIIVALQALLVIFVYNFIPETKGKTTEEIQKDLKPKFS